MRSAEARTSGPAAPAACALRRLALACACLALAACASLAGKVKDEPIPDSEANAPASVGAVPGSAPKPAAAAKAPAAGGARVAGSGGGAGKGGAPGSTAAGGAAAPLVPDIDPAVVRSYDAALHALQDGRLDEAQRGFAALARTNPELGGPHANLGVIYRREDKLAEAVAELEKAVHCNDQQPVYWNQLGITYRQQGQFVKAREAYERSISLDPGYPAPKLNLGILFDLYLWDGQKALELYDRYLALVPQGDEQVKKWVADLKNRNRAAASRKEQE
jgi:tetratricopeptide (TPR) repeat protein